jgi:hypothetical protein
MQNCGVDPGSKFQSLQHLLLRVGNEYGDLFLKGTCNSRPNIRNLTPNLDTRIMDTTRERVER